MSKEKICGIYCIENMINHKKYIGQSVNIFSRWQQHKSELNRKKHCNSKLQNAWNKYGEENFNFYILEKCNFSELDKKEQNYIKNYNSYYNGYNLDFGGTNRVRWTKEMRDKLSLFKTNMSDEEKEKYRLAHQNECIPIYQIDFDGNIINKWLHGAREASKKLHIEQSCIWNCVNHKRKTYKKYIWIACNEYNKNTFNPKDYITHSSNPSSYNMYDLNGLFVKHFNTYKELADYGLDPSGVLKCCNGKIKYYKGYIFKRIA